MTAKDVQSSALLLVAGGAGVIALAPFFSGPVSEWIFAASVLALPAALAGVAFGRRVSPGRSATAMAVMLIYSESVGLTVLAIDRVGRDADPTGMPTSALWMLGGLCLFPLVGISLWYAAAFDGNDRTASSGRAGNRK